MILTFENGRIVKVKEFTFIRKSGGTGLSNGEFNEKWLKNVEVIIIKCWEDYETGGRAWAIPVNPSSDFTKYLERNAKKGRPVGEDGWKETDEYILFISEFDVVDRLEEVIDRLRPVISRVVFIEIENMREFKNFECHSPRPIHCLYFDDGVIVKKEHEGAYREIIAKFKSQES